jgi:hypothetical protein
MDDNLIRAIDPAAIKLPRHYSIEITDWRGTSDKIVESVRERSDGDPAQGRSDRWAD